MGTRLRIAAASTNYSIHCAKVLMRRVIAYLIAVELIAATVTIIRAFS